MPVKKKATKKKVTKKDIYDLLNYLRNVNE